MALSPKGPVSRKWSFFKNFHERCSRVKNASPSVVTWITTILTHGHSQDSNCKNDIEFQESCNHQRKLKSSLITTSIKRPFPPQKKFTFTKRIPNYRLVTFKIVRTLLLRKPSEFSCHTFHSGFMHIHISLNSLYIDNHMTFEEILIEGSSG